MVVPVKYEIKDTTGQVGVRNLAYRLVYSIMALHSVITVYMRYRYPASFGHIKRQMNGVKRQSTVLSTWVESFFNPILDTRSIFREIIKDDNEYKTQLTGAYNDIITPLVFADISLAHRLYYGALFIEYLRLNGVLYRFKYYQARLYRRGALYSPDLLWWVKSAPNLNHGSIHPLLFGVIDAFKPAAIIEGKWYWDAIAGNWGNLLRAVPIQKEIVWYARNKWLKDNLKIIHL